YLRTLLDREVTRNQIEARQVPRVTEATSFLGWHMQSGVETIADAGRMSLQDIETTLLLYFRQTGNPDVDVADLFKAVSDRFWALTSKDDGSFEFTVQPVREYFAARFLAEWAGSDQRDALPKHAVLQELMGRAFWLNTVRFYAGFANPNELAGLRYGIEDALAARGHPLQERVAVWALLTDAVFADAPRVQRDVARMVTDDLSIQLLYASPESDVNFPRLRPQSGGGDVASLLMDDLARAPQGPLVPARVAMLRERVALDRESFHAWWSPQLQQAIGTATETAWLRIGGQFGIPRLVGPELERLTLTTPDRCQAALLAGCSPEPKLPQAEALLRAVLDGWCSDTRTSSSSEAGALLRATRPQWYLQHNEADRDGAAVQTAHLWLTPADRSARSSAWTALINFDNRYGVLKQAGRARALGQGGTTEPWQNPARQLARRHGPCWLAAEIAIAGAASRDTLGSGSIDKNGAPFGEKVDYGTLVLEVHRRPAADWWAHTYNTYRDPLSQRTWALALIATAGDAVIIDLLKHIDDVISGASDNDFLAMAMSSSRLGATRIPRRLSHAVLTAARTTTPRTRLLLTHFASSLDRLDPLPAMRDTDLVELASPDPTNWPIARAITARMTKGINTTLLTALAKLGPTTPLDVPETTNIDPQMLMPILDYPSRYPAAWVFAAERAHVIADTRSTLERVALSQRWVPKIPRL
ncbi:MAG: putative large ATP-binding protein, partial [Myxococcaceae bacterium]|nr:putative large ATP-binding protein [Myxococcaceae bacterium]